MLRPLAILALGLTACGHTEPFRYAPGSQGPFAPTLPRRLTLSQGDDRQPSVTGATIVFSRLELADTNTRERCLAWLPVEGGTLTREVCPPPPRTLGDTFVDTWLEPALAPTGDRIAYMWQEGSLVSVLSFRRARLVVAPAARPADTSGYAQELAIQTSSGQIANSAIELSWADVNTVRFLSTYESIIKVKGGGAQRFTDTTFVPLALMQLDVRTGVISLVRGGDSAIAYAPAPDGGLWLVKSGASATLLHLAAGAGTAVAIGGFSGAVEDLADVGGVAVATVGGTLEVLDPVSGARTLRPPGLPDGPMHRISAAGGNRFVAEAERGAVLFGAPANLWLLELP